MKRKILTVLAILLGLAGLGVLLYPSVSNWMEQAKQRRQIAAYQEAQAQMEQKRRAALLAEADRYNQKLAELGISFDMLGEAEKEALLIDGKSYDELLLAEDSGVMGYLEIEKIKLKLPIYHGVSEEALESGVIWREPPCRLEAKQLMRFCLVIGGFPRQSFLPIWISWRWEIPFRSRCWIVCWSMK